MTSSGWPKRPSPARGRVTCGTSSCVGSAAGIQAGAIFGLGDDAAKVRSLLEKYTAMIPPGMLETIKIGGEPFYRLKPDAESPVIAMGIHGTHLVVGIGDGEAEALLNRMDGKPPEWLAAVRKRLAVDRPAEVVYLNVRKAVQIARAAAGPEAEPVIAALELENYVSYAAVSGLDKEGYVSRSLLATKKPGGIFLGGKPLEAKDLAAIPGDATWAWRGEVRSRSALADDRYDGRQGQPSRGPAARPGGRFRREAVPVQAPRGPVAAARGHVVDLQLARRGGLPRHRRDRGGAARRREAGQGDPRPAAGPGEAEPRAAPEGVPSASSSRRSASSSAPAARSTCWSFPTRCRGRPAATPSPCLPPGASRTRS